MALGLHLRNTCSKQHASSNVHLKYVNAVKRIFKDLEIHLIRAELEGCRMHVGFGMWHHPSANRHPPTSFQLIRMRIMFTAFDNMLMHAWGHGK